MLEPAQRDQIIINLYDSILDPSQAPAALATLDRWFGSDGLHLIGWHHERNMASISLGTQRIAAVAGHYDQHARAIDPRMDLAAKLPLGAILNCHQHFTDHFVRRDPFYQDLLIRTAGMRYIMGARINTYAGEDVFIVLNHEVGKTPFSAEQQHAFGALMPHLVSWFRQLRHTEALRCAAWAGEQGLAALEQGVALLDHRRKLLYLNPVAERYLPAQPGAARHDRSLAGHSGLLEAINRVQRSRQAESLPIAAGPLGEGVIVNVLPLPRDGFQYQGAVGGFTGAAETAAIRTRSHQQGLALHPQGDILLLIRPRQRQQPASAANLAELFDLTPAESRLAHALARGDTAEQYATRHSLSLATVRSQIRAILQKTGEDNLQNLHRLLVLIPAV